MSSTPYLLPSAHDQGLSEVSRRLNRVYCANLYIFETLIEDPRFGQTKPCGYFFVLPIVVPPEAASAFEADEIPFSERLLLEQAKVLILQVVDEIPDGLRAATYSSFDEGAAAWMQLVRDWEPSYREGVSRIHRYFSFDSRAREEQLAFLERQYQKHIEAHRPRGESSP